MKTIMNDKFTRWQPLPPVPGAHTSLAQTVTRPGADGKSKGIDTTWPSSRRKSTVTFGATLPVAVIRMNVWKKPLAAPSARNHCVAGAMSAFPV